MNSFFRIACVGVSVVVGLTALEGCNKKPEPGGPGSVRFAGKEPTEPKLDDVFRLTTPKEPLKIAQGGDGTMLIGIERGKTFDQEVLLKFADLPKGVAIQPAEPVFKREQANVEIRVSAAHDSPLGTATIRIDGNPMRGPEATNHFKITIEKPGR